MTLKANFILLKNVSLLHGYEFGRLRLLYFFFASRWQCFGNAKTKMEVGLEMWRKKALQLYLAF